ncbi:cysteine--tRNA ligase [Candidatus Roizmanbacteria bacterium CG_4_9_14_3_um_filter_33_18]|uniref:Cysteine--tRNA ligase n=3 Tax=Candidatus Roizmaniibacteriota TaxID=1752723 RepID=A0A2M7U8V1_9BACT|nr:MAG: cysteine--tRNA ligase [Candidatus Roizmanbacteria bacterium CG22_combo_CG10-13_8_21_14_all_34_12]PIZ67664.1 MAG: cysteine--tRNA ligase [Candidatus Roizmanbacteria bacterium CG_4_10_14_0_2_um_filter_33_96]PJA55677.1 MAG: cysteine--tRNA ligase [Candidatus Roizmanbacteria bacterium CG_4_9_14_3_um_filter_33_18]
MKLYNSMSRKIEEVKPLNPPNISLYTCGPTVYDFTHIGHMRTYSNNDFLKRALIYLGYKVNHVMNVTDVGHLSGDDDSGEDKMEKGAKKYGKTVWDVAKFYTEFFFKTTDALNIIRPNIVCNATEHVGEMIQLIERLKQNGYVYETKEALYFDVKKFENYGKLSGQKLEEKLQAVREEINVDKEKKHPADFALWFKRVGRFSDHTMHWTSPWGEGFPGWHIECSAMSMEYLGETIDIHSGGIDHVPVHHENEIAQSEGATRKQFVKIWFHNNFLTVDGQKMSKSLGNFYTIEDIEKNKLNPVSLRLLFLQSHYRQSLNFTWQSARASQEAFNRLKEIASNLKSDKILSSVKSSKAIAFQQQFRDALEDDLQTPQAVAVMWDMLKSDIINEEKYFLLMDFDKVFGLNLSNITEEKIDANIITLAEKRLEARKQRNFDASDRLRIKIEKAGFKIEDVGSSYKIKKV